MKQPWSNLRLLSYVLPMGAALLCAAAVRLLGLPVEGRYAVAFVGLTAIAALLIRQELLFVAVSEPVGHWEQRLVSTGARGSFRVTRLHLGLEHLQARSKGIEAEELTLWIPTSDRSKQVWLRAHGADLVVGAYAEDPGPRVARVSFSALGPVYVLLRQGEGPGGASGYVTVPNLAADLVDQEVEIQWFAPRDLPEKDVEAIGLSVAWANHATRLAWQEAVKELSPGNAIRIAVSSRT